MADRPSPSPPTTPPSGLSSVEPSVPEPSPSKLIAVHEEETSETVERFSRLLLEEQDDAPLEMRHPRPLPFTPRASNGQSLPSSLLQASSHTSRPRNRSPYSRSHLRSQSSSASLAAPPMMRAHSSPVFASSYVSSSPYARSSSPLRSPKRVRSPLGLAGEDVYLPPTTLSSDIESIDEDHELDITPRPPENRMPSVSSSTDSSPLPLFHGNTFPLRRRRPASPLYHVTSVGNNTPTSTPQSPSLSATKFNEAFPNDLAYTRSYSSASSMPSTPTSLRSRSPSISSLETIPDTPDAEAEAIEAEKMDRLRRASEGGSESFRRPNAAGFANRDKRKRWSVCGAEKRSDLNLETIWED
ncbi:uncharacterized protein PV09_05392 [Verruconis gallopava]|uniref:Basic proline-rich protein n=1 Tax=Verruconis gallopava TaxID=253628 RepID=A0A0D2AWV0_9PEZI|nr:uncharacterized protein PV09_05392 [Verruconis gallopava]KIW03644.1 hypothetical protein PV09_05392 [Verruconis gallopava]